MRNMTQVHVMQCVKLRKYEDQKSNCLAVWRVVSLIGSATAAMPNALPSIARKTAVFVCARHSSH